ncbi:alpha-glucan family phosphorylase [bacterium]|nr:alpha-glucan family phosphorylase [bacterium]
MTQVEHHFPYIPDRLDRLGDLAYNLWFSWHSKAVRLFQMMDRKLWENVKHNPVRLLHEIDPQRLDDLASDARFLEYYDRVISTFDHYFSKQDTWFKYNFPDKKNSLIAYFSMEFGLHESLPIYSGGLGILAGDHLKSASDLDLPLVGIGLLYREAYFTQFISMHGHQQSIYLYNDYSDMPIANVLEDSGDPLVVKVEIEDREVALRVWEAKIGRISLYLLDTDFHENRSDDREILKRLYIGNRDMRLVQEILLGVGGVRALQAMNIHPAAWHMNEGHCNFSSLERVREMVEKGGSAQSALKKIKANSLFTTHTPVPAGNEVFGFDRVAHFIDPVIQKSGLKKDTLKSLGQEEMSHDPNAFNMTIFSINTSRYINAVSQLHGQVARQMWHKLWPELSLEDVPIGAITNGIHSRTWITSEMKDLFDLHFGEDWRYHLMREDFWQNIGSLPDAQLWKTRQILRRKLRHDIRCRLTAQRERNGEPRESVDEAKNYLERNALTIGFARRVAEYKRATLLFRNRDWLKSILHKPDMPVQIIFAGKSHPENQPGKTLIKEIYDESRNPDFAGKIIFVEDYDMAFARRLISGVDVWMNTPRRPLEASGTSGMKAAANGAVNFSILDGWWQEAYDGSNGWSIGEDREYYNSWEQDEADSRSIYETLEKVILPLFFKRDEDGVPAEWLEIVKNSIKTILPVFNTDRMVRDYTMNYYKNMMK